MAITGSLWLLRGVCELVNVTLLNICCLHGAFPIKIKTLHSVFLNPLVSGLGINSALTVHFLHSLGRIPASRSPNILQARTCQLKHSTCNYRILLGPHLYTWLRAAMWIKCLAEGPNIYGGFAVDYGIEPTCRLSE